MSVIKKAETIEEIRRVCRPDPLNDKNLSAFFVETDQVRDPHQRTRELILSALEMGDNVKLLFSGYKGCGKSTELNKFIAENRNDFFIVNFSAHREMNPIAGKAEDLVLIIAERLLNAAIKNKNKVHVNGNWKLISSVIDFWGDITINEKTGMEPNLETGANFSAEDGLLEKLVGVLAKLKADAKVSVHGDETKVAKLRKRPAILLAYTNMLIDAVRDQLTDGKRLLIIVDDLDKLDIQKARDIFINNISTLTSINADIIYTVPIFLFHSSDVGALTSNFDKVISLPMIKMWEPPDAKAEDGYKKIRNMIFKRINENLIEKDALDLLIEKTGGVLRHVFEVLQATAFMADLEPPIKKEHIKYGLKKLQGEFWGHIALPYESFAGGPSSVNELYDKLTEYAIQQRKGEKCKPVPSTVNQILLKACALVEYNGDRWFGVHPLVLDNLKTMGRLS